MRYSRENVITRSEYEATEERRPKQRRPYTPSEDVDDRKTAKRAVSNPSVLRDWLVRVEGRFMGSPVEITPEDALIQALRITAGEVAYCDAQIARLSEDELFERPTQTKYAEMPSGQWEMIEEKRDAAVISRWQQLRADAVNRMARYAKMALDVGVEEKRVQVSAAQARMMARFLEGVMGEIELTPEQRRVLAPTMRKHLELIETTAVNVT